jgi:nicotinate-nucleotide adenylyltransferase
MWSAGPAPRLPSGGRPPLLRPGFSLARGQTVGLFGGSFDPAHDGHAHVAQTALRRLGLDKVIWLVSPQNPLKPRSGDLKGRMASAKRFARGPSMIVSDVESRIGSSYTIDTLRALKARFPGVHFVWIMGADNLSALHRWRGWTQIVHETPIAVIARPGSALKSRLAPAATRFSPYRLPSRQARLLALTAAPAWLYMREPLNFSSSSAIRAKDSQEGR